MHTVSAEDGGASFDISVVAPAHPTRTALFAVGGGGDPRRHAPLIAALAARGCLVIAPHVERLTSTRPDAEHLELRARRLRLAADAFAPDGLPLVGVGHSLGGTMLLALAGGEVWLGPGRPLPLPSLPLERLALLSPATGFFRAPGALDAVAAPLLVLVGEDDTITPPADARLLERGLAGRAPVSLRVVPQAGHFAFMHELPPGVREPAPDRAALLDAMTQDVCRFISEGST